MGPFGKSISSNTAVVNHTSPASHRQPSGSSRGSHHTQVSNTSLSYGHGPQLSHPHYPPHQDEMILNQQQVCWKHKPLLEGDHLY